MNSFVGPDGLPAVFDGGAWRSHDGRFWWNGAAWVPTTRSDAGPWLVKIGIGVILVSLLVYAIYTTAAAQSEYSIGYALGVIAFFATLFVVYRYVGRWGWFGGVIRAGCFLLALLKVLTLIVHPPPA